MKQSRGRHAIGKAPSRAALRPSWAQVSHAEKWNPSDIEKFIDVGEPVGIARSKNSSKKTVAICNSGLTEAEGVSFPDLRSTITVVSKVTGPKNRRLQVNGSGTGTKRAQTTGKRRVFLARRSSTTGDTQAKRATQRQSELRTQKLISQSKSYIGDNAEQLISDGTGLPVTTQVLDFPSSVLRKLLKKIVGCEKVSNGAAVYISAVLEYLVVELLELAGHTALLHNKRRILPRHIQIVVRNDRELEALMLSPKR